MCGGWGEGEVKVGWGGVEGVSLPTTEFKKTRDTDTTSSSGRTVRTDTTQIPRQPQGSPIQWETFETLELRKLFREICPVVC